MSMDTDGWLDVSDETPRVAYTATSGQTAFTVPFAFLEEADLDIYVNDTLKTLSTHYTTSGAGEDAGGAISLVTAATAGDSVVIVRNLALALTTHVPTSGPLDIPALNEQFSRIMMMLQQVFDAIERGIIQPDSDAATMARLAVAASRASKYLFFDASGNPTAVASVSSSAAVAAFWVTVLQTTTELAARSALGITDQSSYTGLSNWRTCR